MASSQRISQDSRGRVSSAWTDDELLDILLAVAGYARPLRPTAVTQTAWDEARAPALAAALEADPEFFAAGKKLPPTARAAVMRLNSRCVRHLTWKQWLDVAGKDGASRRQSLVAAQRSTYEGPVSDHRARYALRRVALDQGTHTLSPDDYEAGRVAIVTSRARAQQARQGPGAAVVEMLPTADQIQRERTWRDALKLADLKPPARNPEQRKGPFVKSAGLPAPEAQAWFARYNGRYASHQRLREFCAACNVSLADWPKGRPYSECHDEADAILHAWGEPVPQRAGRKREGGPGRLTDFKLPPDAVIPGAPPKEEPTEGQSVEERRQQCVDALAAFDGWMRDAHPGVRATQKRYLNWQKGSGWPSHSRFHPFGGFTALLAEARSRGQRETEGAPDDIRPDAPPVASARGRAAGTGPDG